MIKTIFFDLDDTLLYDKKSVKMAFQATCELAEKKYHIDGEMLEKVVRQEARKLYSSYPTYEFTQMIGINPFEGLWGDFLDDGEYFEAMSKIVPTYRKQAWTNGLKILGIHDTEFGELLATEFPKQRKKHPYVYEDTYFVLEQLKEQYQLVLLTNGSPSLQQLKLSITPELQTYFNHIVISGEFGRGKPDPAIFKHAAALANTEYNEIIMIGDNLSTDILGSNRTGIKNIWINHDNKQLKDIRPTYQVQTLKDIHPLLANLI